MPRRRALNSTFDQPARTLCLDMAVIGSVLRKRRKELGYTQMQVAQFCGFSQRLISEIERGRGSVAIEKVMQYANGLGIDFILQIRGKA